MTLLFNYSPSGRVLDAITSLCTRAVQSGKRIAIFELPCDLPCDLRDMTMAELKTAKIGVGLERREAICSVPELMFAFRLYEQMSASLLAVQGSHSTKVTDEITVSTEFTRDDLQYFLNRLQPDYARLQDFDE